MPGETRTPRIVVASTVGLALPRSLVSRVGAVPSKRVLQKLVAPRTGVGLTVADPKPFLGPADRDASEEAFHSGCPFSPGYVGNYSRALVTSGNPAAAGGLALFSRVSVRQGSEISTFFFVLDPQVGPSLTPDLDTACEQRSQAQCSAQLLLSTAPKAGLPVKNEDSIRQDLRKSVRSSSHVHPVHHISSPRTDPLLSYHQLTPFCLLTGSMIFLIVFSGALR